MIDNPKTNLEALYGQACSDVMRYLENTLCVMKRADSGMEAF